MVDLSRRALFPSLAGAALDGNRQRPNVLFFVVDDLNTKLGCYGAPVRSPHIDGLARSGVTFARAYCQYPLCNPSRASLLTGRRPPATRVTDNHHWFRIRMPGVVTLPAHFRRNGYLTAQLGKVFHGGRDDKEAWDIGGTAGSEGQEMSPEAQTRRGPVADRWSALPGNGEDQPDYATASRTVQTLGKLRDENKPFFLAVGFLKPHVPLVAPKKFFDLYDPAKIKLPADFALQPPSGDWPYRPNFDLFSARQATPALAREGIAAYYACISFMDAQVGRVLAELDRLRLRRNTVVVLWGDNGWHLGDKGLWAKLTLFEDSVRVPLLVSAPGASATGRTCRRPVESVDIYPTLAEWCGLPSVQGLEGRSLAPLLRDPAAAWDRPAYSFLEDRVHGVSVRTERYRYTEWDGGSKGTELYDYRSHLPESKNLAALPEHAARVGQMRQLLRQAGG